MKQITSNPVTNSGIALINNYLPALFDRLKLLKDNEFRTTTAQMQAVHYLQFVVTGSDTITEASLPLNNVLCGLPASQPVPHRIVTSDEQKKLIEGMLKSVINHWPASNNPSLTALRETWLQRTGVLGEQEDQWELTVEKRSIDVLINESPFSFSVIRYPWMEKPVHVKW
ncbi:MAG TPA: contractile injection system tape measure protein [Bacteroidia bacterium]|nr:contractile injection system tape measure protein [Bacteroidia bacterium]